MRRRGVVTAIAGALGGAAAFGAPPAGAAEKNRSAPKGKPSVVTADDGTPLFHRDWGYAYPYPDFLQVVCHAQAWRFVPCARELNGDELGASFQPVVVAQALPLTRGERAYLTAALQDARGPDPQQFHEVLLDETKSGDSRPGRSIHSFSWPGASGPR